MTIPTVFIVAMALTVFGLLCFLLSTGLWRKTKLGRRFISPRKKSSLRDGVRILRPAGYSLQEKINDLSIDLMFWALGSIMIPIFGVVIIYISSGTMRNSISSVVLIGMVFVVGLTVSRRLSKKIQNYRIGLDGELATAEELNQLMRNGYHVFHDFPATDKFNIDHIVIGPTGIFAVETKSRSKQFGSGEEGAVVKQEGSVLQFPKFRDSKSVKQAHDQAKWLSKFLTKRVGKEVFATPVIAIPGWFVKRGLHDGSVLVYNPVNGSKIITNRPRVLDDQTIQQAAYQVEQCCRDVKPFNPL
jgi:hypothetical protein